MPCPKSATVNGQQTVPGPRHRVCVNLICCRLPKKKVSEWAEEGVWQGQWADEGVEGEGLPGSGKEPSVSRSYGKCSLDCVTFLVF